LEYRPISFQHSALPTRAELSGPNSDKPGLITRMRPRAALIDKLTGFRVTKPPRAAYSVRASELGL
jgi:hypothetical protein